MSKKLINSAQDVVVDMLEGLVACHPHLQMVNGLPDVSVEHQGCLRITVAASVHSSSARQNNN